MPISSSTCTATAGILRLLCIALAGGRRGAGRGTGRGGVLLERSRAEIHSTNLRRSMVETARGAGDGRSSAAGLFATTVELRGQADESDGIRGGRRSGICCDSYGGVA